MQLILNKQASIQQPATILLYQAIIINYFIPSSKSATLFLVAGPGTTLAPF
jgi:hypothetical protein